MNLRFEMARYEITVSDEDRDEQPDTPWNATITGMTDVGKSSEVLASGLGSTPREAVEEALDDILNYADVSEWAV